MGVRLEASKCSDRSILTYRGDLVRRAGDALSIRYVIMDALIYGLCDNVTMQIIEMRFEFSIFRQAPP